MKPSVRDIKGSDYVHPTEPQKIDYRTIYICLAIMVVVIVLAFFIARNTESIDYSGHEIIGIWQLERNPNYTYTFNANGRESITNEGRGKQI